MNFEPWIESDKRRDTHQVRWRDVNGKKCRDKYTYTNRPDAKDRLRIVRDMLVNQSLGRVDLSRSPAECMEAFLKDMEDEGSTRVELFRTAIERFLNFKDSHGRKVIQSLEDFKRENILSFKTSLMGEKLSPHTVQTYMSSCLRRWLGWCVDHKWLAVQPYEKIGVPTPRKVDRFFTDQELSDFEAVINNEEFRAIFRLGYRCGLRPGERLRVKEEHISWDKALKKGELYIPPDDAKSDAGGRYAELPEDVYAILPKRKGLLFENWTEQRMNRHYGKAKEKAGIEDRVLKGGRTVFKTLYWTRHTYAKRYLERGGSLKVLSIRMGHESIEITADTYGNLERSAIHDIQVPAIPAGQAPQTPNLAGQMRGKMADFIVIPRNVLKADERDLNGGAAVSKTVK